MPFFDPALYGAFLWPYSPAKGIDEPHLLDSIAMDLKEPGAHQDHPQRADPGDRHVQPITTVNELDVSWQLLTATGYHGNHQGLGLLPLKLANRLHPPSHTQFDTLNFNQLSEIDILNLPELGNTAIRVVIRDSDVDLNSD